MKSKSILWLIAILIILLAFYTVNLYNSNEKPTKEETNKGTVQGTSTAEDILDDVSDDQKESDELGSSSSEQTTKAKDFTLTDLNGKSVSLSDYLGKNVYVNFWATWCPPCNAEMPELESLYQETKESDLVILSVDIGESHSTVSDFMEEKGYDFAVLLDEKMTVASAYGINSIPTSIFINKDGDVVYTKLGAMTLQEMKDAVDQLK